MMAFLTAHAATIVVGALLAAVVILIVLKLRRDRRKGCASCGCGCGGACTKKRK